MTKKPRAARTTLGNRTAAAGGGAASSSPLSKAASAGERADVEHAIVTELAPAVAIALLATTLQRPNEPAAALECLAAGVSTSVNEGKVRVQLLFENGTVLPVEMSKAAGDALKHGLAEELGSRTE